MRKRRTVIVVLAVVAVAAIAIFLIRRSSGKKQAEAQRTQAQAAARAIPVVSAPVQRRDVPIYLDGLGNVAAFYTVTVRTQVDGRLDEVLFREGQLVKKGDPLARIDPRPFENQLAQAQGALERDRAQLKGAKLNLDYASIRSPIDGVTGVRVVDPGNVVHAGDANGLVVITQLDPITVLFSLPQDELPRVMQELQRAAIAVEAWSRDGAQKLATGQLALVDNQINAATATLRLKAVFPNPQRLLWPNQFVKARLLLTTRKDALVVPSTVPQRGPEGTFAYVIQQDQTVQPRNNEVEHTEGDQAVIGKGLAENEQVVVDGQNQLRAGSKVAPRQAGQPGRVPREGEGPRADTPRSQKGPRQ